MVMNDRSWSLSMEPVYEDYEPHFDGVFRHHYMSTLKYVKVAVKYHGREVLTFHAVRPAPPEPEYIYSYSRLVDLEDNPHDLDLNPLKQLLDDAELGRRMREAGLELK